MKTQQHLQIDPATLFTPREFEVVVDVSKGHCDKQIGKDQCISSHTAAAHINNARHKVHARNRAHLIAICYQLGVLPALIVVMLFQSMLPAGLSNSGNDPLRPRTQSKITVRMVRTRTQQTRNWREFA